MKIILHRNFIKRFKKLRKGEQSRFRSRRDLFLQNPFHPILDNHPLQGKFVGYRSFSIGGDLSVVYRHEKSDLVVFSIIGTHHELYGS